MQFDYFYGNEAEQFTFYRIPKVLVSSPQSEFDLMFAPEDKMENRGCICYIRGYFDNSVDERLQTSAMIENKDNYNKYRTKCLFLYKIPKQQLVQV